MKQLNLLYILLFVFVLNAESNTDSRRTMNNQKKVYAIFVDKFIRIPPPKDFLLKSANENKCNIEVQYNGFTEEAKVAFEYAVSIWESLLVSDQIINVEANWTEFENEDSVVVLGSAGAASTYANCEGMPSNKLFYVTSLAEKLTHQNLNRSNNPEIYAYFNSETNWYYGTDGNTPSGKFDLVSVVLHELCHGLGFDGSMGVTDSNEGIWGYGSKYADSFDSFILNSSGQKLIDLTEFENPSSELLKQYTSNNISFDGPVLHYNTNNKANLYAPNEYEVGSSIYHLSREFDNTQHRLMTPGITTASSIHDPGIITRSILEDIGWSTISITCNRPSNQEEILNITIEAEIIPDFQTELIDPSISYSINNSDYITEDLVAIGDHSIFKKEIEINEKADIRYYISVKDKYGRTFYYPNSVPEEPATIVVGPDTIEPVISHLNNENFYIDENELIILCAITDNFGVDSVWIQYFVNGNEKNPLPLQLLKDDLYNVVVNFDNIHLEIGDTITYRIIAKDVASAGNTSF
ncbi:MAG: hypothetical protein PF541_17320, partial [Prolixibacteraceae bacterium]|nr:hypothetical protein [Prolixibacteraceae bacterium]